MKKNKSSKKKVGVIISGIILFLIITFVLLLAGDAQFSILDRLFSKQYRLQVNVQPDGSQVFIDGDLEGKTPLGIDISGKRLIRVEHDGYLPYETEVEVREEQIIIGDTLTLIPFVVDIDIPVKNYVFIDSANLIFGKSNEIYSWNHEEMDLTFLSTLPTIPAEISFSPHGESVLLTNYGLYNTILEYYSVGNGKTQIISNDIENFAWGPQPSHFSIIVSDRETMEIRIYSDPDSFVTTEIDQSDNLRFLHSLHWSPTGSRFVIEEIGKIVFYTYEAGQTVLEETMEPANYPLFSPTDDNKISYINDSLNLILVDLETGEQEVVGEGVSAPYQWRPDGLAIICTTYNSTEGETAFWQIDLQSGNKTYWLTHRWYGAKWSISRSLQIRR